MNTVRLREYQSQAGLPLPRPVADILRTRFSKQLTVTRSFESDGGYDLTAGDWVGQIVFGDTAIVIDPKTPVDNLFYMLTYAYKLPEFQRETFPFDVAEDVFELIILIFARQVESLARRGIYRGYVAWDENLPMVQGRLLMSEQVRRNPVQLHRFYTRRDEFTADVLENRLLKAVIFKLSRFGYHQPDLRHRLLRLLRSFDEVSQVSIMRDDFDRVLYGRLNGHYKPVHALARLLWDHLSLESAEGEHPCASYLLNMWQVFEVFVAEYLAEFLTTVLGVDVAIQQNLWLDLDQRVTGIPDIVLKVWGEPAVVLDTKYKLYSGKPSNDDLNQMVAYCHRLGLDTAILIYPGAVPADRFQFKEIGVEVRSIDLGGDLSTFRKRCQVFADSLFSVMNTSGFLTTQRRLRI